MAKLRVVIIGAGGAGLSMCRCLADEPQIDFVAFEKSHEIGGVWQYTKDNKECVFRTPMYKNLRYCLSTDKGFLSSFVWASFAFALILTELLFD